MANLDAVNELIRQAVNTLLASVQVPGPVQVNGADVLTSLTVEEVDPFFMGAGDLHACAEFAGDDWVDAGDRGAALGRDTWDLELLVNVRITRPGGGIPFDRRALYAAAAVRKAIRQSAYDGALQPMIAWCEPAGNKIKGVIPFSNEQGVVAGVTIPFLIRYLTAKDDPFN